MLAFPKGLIVSLEQDIIAIVEKNAPISPDEIIKALLFDKAISIIDARSKITSMINDSDILVMNDQYLVELPQTKIEVKTYPGYVDLNHIVPEADKILVFGSNTEGRHGKGVAKIALDKWGAKYGQPHGLQGQSYAIVTKDLTKKEHPSVSATVITNQIKELYEFARNNKDKSFYIPYRGDGQNLNAYSSYEMAQMFKKAGPIPENVLFEEYFVNLIQIDVNKLINSDDAEYFVTWKEPSWGSARGVLEWFDDGTFFKFWHPYNDDLNFNVPLWKVTGIFKHRTGYEV